MAKVNDVEIKVRANTSDFIREINLMSLRMREFASRFRQPARVERVLFIQLYPPKVYWNR